MQLNVGKGDNMAKKENKEKNVKKEVSTSKKEKVVKKQNIWEKFMVFCNGVKSETKKIRWTSKQDMLKYSIATIIFIVFCSLFFYGIDTIFALIQSLFN